MQPDISLIKIYQLPTGRRTFALGQTREAIAAGTREAGEPDGSGDTLAETRYEAPLLVRVDEAIAYDRETRALELRFGGQRSKAQHDSGAHGTDNLIDYTLTAMDDSLAHDIRVFPVDGPRHIAASRLRKTILPAGASAVTSLDYYTELETVGTILRLTADPAVAADIATTKLDSHFDRLTELHRIFATQVGVGQQGVVRYDQVTQRRKTGHRNASKIVAWILGHYLDDSPAHLTARARLLGPILDQNLKLRRLYARGKMTDVDPDTGEEIDPVITES